MSLGAARTHAARELLVNFRRNQKLRVLRPAVVALRHFDLFLTERISVRLRGILHVRSAVADVAVDHDESRSAAGLGERAQRLFDPPDVVRIADAHDIPAVRDEACDHILGEGDRGGSLDGDVVVVVNPAEVVEAQVSRQGRRLGAHALHHATVAAHRVHPVVEQLVPGLVIAIREEFLGHRHAHARRDALTERTRGRLDAGNPMIFRVAGRFAIELAKALDLLEGNGGSSHLLVVRIHRNSARQVQDRPLQHRGMTIGEHEAVAVRPNGVRRIEAHDAIPERIDERRERHGRARVARVGLLHGIDR